MGDMKRQRRANVKAPDEKADRKKLEANLKQDLADAVEDGKIGKVVQLVKTLKKAKR